MERINLVKDSISAADVHALCHWLLGDPMPRLTKGDLTLTYEKEYAKICNRAFAVFVSSGSSANLLAMYSLVVSGRMKNKKVVIPALSWITTVSPAIQLGLEPILCDINMRNLGVDTGELEKIFKEHSPAVLFLVSVLGMPPDMIKICDLCIKYDVVMIMDNCESQYTQTEWNHPIEKYGLMSTCSSYMGHVTSTIEGGMVTTDNYDLYQLMLMLRSHGWDRDLDKGMKKELQQKNEVGEFNKLYTFYEPGFNLRSTEISAFFGLRQLKKLKKFAMSRHDNFMLYQELIVNKFWKPNVRQHTVISNLGYPVIHRYRNDIATALLQNNIECRPLISGSMGRQPFWKSRYGVQIMRNADQASDWGMYIPNHPELTTEEIRFIASIINKFTNAH